MFKKIFAVAARTLVRAVVEVTRRFLDNAPRNLYENIAFNMLRTGASHFGRERVVVP